MKILKNIATFLLLIIIYNLLLYSICLFPSELVYDNCLKSAKQMQAEGGFTNTITPLTNFDNYTDILIINESYSIDNTDPLESYLKVRKNYNKEYTKVVLPDKNGELRAYFDDKYDENGNPLNSDYDTILECLNFLDKKVSISVEYARYYHGYLVLYRPLLILFDIIGIRIITFIIFLVLFIMLGYELKKKFNLTITIIYLLALFSFDYFLIPFSMQVTPVFLIMMITLIIMLKYIDNISFSTLCFSAMIVGSLTCYFDYFTVPTITLTIPLFTYVYYLVKNKKYDYKELFINVLKVCIVWSLGYALTWASKWIITDLLLGTSIIQSALEQAFYRGLNTPIVEKDAYLVFVKHFAFVGTIIILFIIIKDSLNNKLSDDLSFNNKHVLTFISLIPIAWSIITFQHFIRHSIFTFRQYLVVAIYFTILLVDILKPKIKKIKKH